jgi:hypothetical protein
MIPVNTNHIECLVELLVNGTPGNFVYIGTNMEQAAQAKALLVAMMRGKQAHHIPRSSLKREYVTEAQRFLFTSTRSVMAGYARGLSMNQVYLDVDEADRVELLPIILPVVCRHGGQIF